MIPKKQEALASRLGVKEVQEGTWTQYLTINPLDPWPDEDEVEIYDRVIKLIRKYDRVWWFKNFGDIDLVQPGIIEMIAERTEKTKHLASIRLYEYFEDRMLMQGGSSVLWRVIIPLIDNHPSLHTRRKYHTHSFYDDVWPIESVICEEDDQGQCNACSYCWDARVPNVAHPSGPLTPKTYGDFKRERFPTSESL